MRYMIQTTLSNKTHPEYGVATVAFPIPKNEYDQTIETLGSMGIGDALSQDCQVGELSSGYPVLTCLSGQSVNLDELDYLAKRLESFSTGEDAQFQTMAHKLNLSNIQDLINLTFSCQQATVITDFANLEEAGKSHSLTVSGGSMPMDEFDKVDGQAVALKLIQSGKGEVTPYGVVYDNGMKLEQVYDGRHFPPYFYEIPLLSLAVMGERPDSPVGYLCLPASDKQIERTLLRAGSMDVSQAVWNVEMSELSKQVDQAVDWAQESISSLNELCRAIEPLDAAQKEKLDAIILMAQPSGASEVRQLAENLDQFEFVSDVQTLEDYGRYMIQESGHFAYDENLEGFYDYRLYGEIRSRDEGGEFTDLGYVSYHGTLPLDELMRNDSAEQERGPTMGGFS